MPREPLQSISSNIVHHKELNEYTRGKIIGARNAGMRPAHIATQLNLPPTTIHTTLRRDEQRDNGQSDSRSGRPRATDDRDERTLLRLIRIDPKITYEDLIEKSGVQCSQKTVYRLLREAGITNWRMKRCPLLRLEDVKARYQWAKLHKDWTKEMWSRVIWSDECSVERGSGKKREWVFRTPAQKWHKDMIQPTQKGKDISIMVWAAFWGGGSSDLYPLERDYELKKHGYSANSYIDVLDQNLTQFYEPGLIFMQDNASIHTAHKVRRWFENHGVEVMEWPPYSPDLNPIEHLWYRLKELLYTRHPELLELGKGNEACEAMTTALIEVWKEIERQLMDSLIDSMTTRVNAVLEAKGWYTRF